MGSAIGLLLAFRSNTTYQRLDEARRRGACGAPVPRGLPDCRDGAPLRRDRGQLAEARTAAAQVCKCLAAWAWELNAKLTGPQKIRTTQVYSDDIVEILLPPSEAKWLQKQRSRPLQILGGLRRVLHRQWAVGNLASHLHRKLEEDLRELDVVVGGCERLFSSPLPRPGRHAMRCLFLWIMALPIALASSTSMAPLSIALGLPHDIHLCRHRRGGRAGRAAVRDHPDDAAVQHHHGQPRGSVRCTANVVKRVSKGNVQDRQVRTASIHSARCFVLHSYCWRVGRAAARISTLLFAEFERLFEDKDRARRFAAPRNAASNGGKMLVCVIDRPGDDCAARSMIPGGGHTHGAGVRELRGPYSPRARLSLCS